MKYQFRDKKQIARRRNLIKTLLVCGVFFLLSISGFFSWTSRFFVSIGVPIWKVENSFTNGIHSFDYLFNTRASLFNEKENLLAENNNLKIKMVDYQLLETENNQLKELLGRVKPKDRFVLVSILVRPNRSPYDTIIVDAGTDENLREGLRVYANTDLPIGEINKVYKNTSVVTLYSNPGNTVEASLDGSNASVELVGRGGGNFEMTVPMELSTETGASVVLPGISSEIIAIIDAVISAPTDPVKKVILHSPVNIQSLKWVQVKLD